MTIHSETRICTKCDGLGMIHRDISTFAPWSNAYGWTFYYAKGYALKSCEACKGEGFRPFSRIVPSVPMVKKISEIA